MQIRYVETDAELATLCAEMAGAPWLALDTEFMREKNYYAKLCLIQVADAHQVACIDPLAVSDLTPFFQLLDDPAMVKVFHAARQDLEIIHQLTGKVPEPLFDTQIAASVLGHGEQIGYGNLVERVLGVRLEKGQARTDWSLRPLDPAQLEYAADDVRYLRDLYREMHAELEGKGRLAWLADDFAELASPTLYANPPEQAWQRIKGRRKLHGVQLAVLRELAAWREVLAQRIDRPRRWVLSDDTLLDIARRRPDSSHALGRIRGVEERTLSSHGKALLDAIERGNAVPEAEWPVLPDFTRLGPNQEALVDLLMALLRLRAEHHEVSTPAIASRNDLEQLVQGDRDLPLLHGWRKRLAGGDLLALLEGRLVLRVRDGALSIEAA